MMAWSESVAGEQDTLQQRLGTGIVQPDLLSATMPSMHCSKKPQGGYRQWHKQNTEGLTKLSLYHYHISHTPCERPIKTEERRTCCIQHQSPTSDETRDAFEMIAKTNANLTKTLTHGDIMPNLKRNADPCTAIGCKWPKTGSYVYVPVAMTGDFSSQERDVIIRALVSFHQSTCIRFVWRSTEADYLIFYSGTGCWSYVGRQRNQQPISLQRNGCIYYSTVQHEVIHALGFHHEHVRSDRDSYVNIYTQNVQTGMESNFMKVQTNNLGTPYDFNSVMHYPNYAFSKNGLPTISAKSNPNMVLGGATQMSSNDIARKQLHQLVQSNELSRLLPHIYASLDTIVYRIKQDFKPKCRPPDTSTRPDYTKDADQQSDSNLS
ncbi:hypothetical protein Q8A73_002637 [Channa argus]|nr:hypothetical protein Q8A73_002637 [Channa argus]